MDSSLPAGTPLKSLQPTILSHTLHLRIVKEWEKWGAREIGSLGSGARRWRRHDRNVNVTKHPF